jgi:pimeloyl-ACP methyl ester carboxylesterase
MDQNTTLIECNLLSPIYMNIYLSTKLTKSILAVSLCLGLTCLSSSADEAVTYHSVQVDGQNIFYRESGPSDGPVVLFLHGFPSSSRYYEPFLHSGLNARYHLVAPDYPGFGHSSWPDPKTFNYTFDHLSAVMLDFADQLHLGRYSLYVQDYGGPVGFRMAVKHPEQIDAIIVQNAVVHEEGLSSLWVARRAFFADRSAHEAALRKKFLSLDTTRQRHVGSSPHPERIDPDTWQDEFYFLNQPGQAEIQSDLFYDYRTNLESYPLWQKWLRDHQPLLLVLWGQYDPSFTVAGAEAFKREVPSAEVDILDAGHFALDEQPDQMIQLMQTFLDRQQHKSADTTPPSH